MRHALLLLIAITWTGGSAFAQRDLRESVKSYQRLTPGALQERLLAHCSGHDRVRPVAPEFSADRGYACRSKSFYDLDDIQKNALLAFARTWKDAEDEFEDQHKFGRGYFVLSGRYRVNSKRVKDGRYFGTFEDILAHKTYDGRCSEARRGGNRCVPWEEELLIRIVMNNELDDLAKKDPFAAALSATYEPPEPKSQAWYLVGLTAALRNLSNSAQDGATPTTTPLREQIQNKLGELYENTSPMEKIKDRAELDRLIDEELGVPKRNKDDN